MSHAFDILSTQYMPTGGCNLKALRDSSTTVCTHSRPCLSRRHVILPGDIAGVMPKDRLLSETEWRGYGVQQSRGWVHYMIHNPEPHILLFRRPLFDQQGRKVEY